jgi:hypothetical protein
MLYIKDHLFMNALRISRSRFTRPAFLWALVALATEIAVKSHRELRPTESRLLILLPLIPLLFFLLTLVQAIQKMDELQKRICLESVFIAFALTLAFTFVVAALEQAGIYSAPWNGIGTLMMFLWACAYVVSAWRYR